MAILVLIVRCLTGVSVVHIYMSVYTISILKQFVGIILYIITQSKDFIWQKQT